MRDDPRGPVVIIDPKGEHSSHIATATEGGPPMTRAELDAIVRAACVSAILAPSGAQMLVFDPLARLGLSRPRRATVKS